jgi:hypothetical protein
MFRETYGFGTNEDHSTHCFPNAFVLAFVVNQSNASAVMQKLNADITYHNFHNKQSRKEVNVLVKLSTCQ